MACYPLPKKVRTPGSLKDVPETWNSQIDLRTILPKIKSIPKKNEEKAMKIRLPTSEENEEDEYQDQEPEESDEAPLPERYDSSLLDLHMVLPRIITMTKVSLIYEIEDVGMYGEQKLAIFTDKDCLNLAKTLADSPSIEIFELNKGHMTGEQCKTLVREGLIHMVHLKSLNLSYNEIGNVGATALARLISDKSSRVPHTLHTLKICRNVIRTNGAKALAFGLSLNTHLTELDLRLNFIKSPGGQDIGHALAENKSLRRLAICGNRLGEEACYVIGKMLAVNHTLLELDMSSNKLQSKGGEHLALGMINNKTLVTLDIRLANVGYQFAYDIMVLLRKNRERLGYSIDDMEDFYPPEEEEQIEEEASEAEFSSDEEEEEGEDAIQFIKSARHGDGSIDSSDHAMY